MDPCHILLDEIKEEKKTTRESIDRMFNATFEKEVQNLMSFLLNVPFEAQSVDIVHRWWDEMIHFKLAQKYGFTSRGE